MEVELPTEHLEHVEHAHHAVEEGNRFLITVSATIAALAVLAAIMASIETVETSASISEKNEAVLKQEQASDQWSFYQAKSVKLKIVEVAGLAASTGNESFKKDAIRYAAELIVIKEKAEELEHERNEKLETSEKHEQRHHRLTYAVTLVQVGIAMATLSIIMKGKRWPYIASLLFAAIGALVAVSAYL